VQVGPVFGLVLARITPAVKEFLSIRDIESISHGIVHACDPDGTVPDGKIDGASDRNGNPPNDQISGRIYPGKR
jgi:hypothetical protein